MKTANHRTRLVLQCDCDFFYHKYRMSEKESKGGEGKERQAMSVQFQSTDRGKLHPKKCSNTRKEKIPEGCPPKHELVVLSPSCKVKAVSLTASGKTYK